MGIQQHRSRNDEPDEYLVIRHADLTDIRDRLIAIEGILESLGKPDMKLLLTRKEAAEALGISVSQVDNLRRSDQLAAVTVGSSKRYHWDDLLAFIEDHKQSVSRSPARPTA